MSAMLLCRSRRVKHPYYVEELGIHLYSGEELSYYIYHNAMLIGTDFLDERLYRFIGQELGMETLEAKLRRWSSQAALSELLMVILQDIHYYNNVELAGFRKSLEEMDRMSAAEKMANRGDYLVKNRRYTAAMLQYDRLLTGDYTEMRDPVFRGRIWMSCGVTYARQFCWQQAAECLEKAWECDPQVKIQRMLYQILCRYPQVEADPGILEGLPEELLQQWNGELKDAVARASDTGKGEAVARWMSKDSIRRAEGLSLLAEEWKKEFRRNQGN